MQNVDLYNRFKNHQNLGIQSCDEIKIKKSAKYYIITILYYIRTQILNQLFVYNLLFIKMFSKKCSASNQIQITYRLA